MVLRPIPASELIELIKLTELRLLFSFRILSLRIRLDESPLPFISD